VEQYPDEGTHLPESETWEREDADINLISNRQLPTLVQGISDNLFWHNKCISKCRVRNGLISVQLCVDSSKFQVVSVLCFYFSTVFLLPHIWDI
jgi:hypothetical protein